MASFTLGILAVLCLQFLAGLPAIVLGHVARRRAVRAPDRYGGRRLASAGLALGYASLCTTILLGVALSSLAKLATLEMFCRNNLHQIHLAMDLYARDNQGLLPDDFMRLTNDLPSPRFLVCPADPKHRVPQVEWPPWDPDNVSYTLLAPGVARADATNQVLVRCPIHPFDLHGDGTVQGRAKPAQKSRRATSPPPQ